MMLVSPETRGEVEMGQFRDIPVPENAVRVRLDLSEEQVTALKRIGLDADIALSAVCRLAMGMLAEGRAVDAEAIIEEAKKVRAANAPPKKEPRPKRPPGRPKKATTDGKRKK
jgi:hypothetical protein